MEFVIFTNEPRWLFYRHISLMALGAQIVAGLSLFCSLRSTVGRASVTCRLPRTWFPFFFLPAGVYRFVPPA